MPPGESKRNVIYNCERHGKATGIRNCDGRNPTPFPDFCPATTGVERIHTNALYSALQPIQRGPVGEDSMAPYECPIRLARN
jgi:hypothetical protein